MRISFDLDDTLIFYGSTHEYEDNIKFPLNIFMKEKLRKGTINLIKRLESDGHKICVYTTSERSVKYIKFLFRLHGIKLEKIINQIVHMKIVQGDRKDVMPSKVPSKFGIDLHIDDDNSVKMNGIQHGFNVLIIKADDPEWGNKVLAEIERIKRIREAQLPARRR